MNPLWADPDFPTIYRTMSRRPWLDAIDDPQVEQELKQSTPSNATPANPKKIPPQKRVHLWAAPIHDNKLPSESDFMRVGCVQMTGQGATFLWPGAYHQDLVMLAVGTVKKAYYLQSKVIARTSNPNGSTHIVCEFLKRY